MISFILPTRDRPERLGETLEAIGGLAGLAGVSTELVVVDNASAQRVRVPERLDNGAGVELVRLEGNAGTAARNVAAERASGEWLVMLDDDSYPLDTGFLEALNEAPPQIAAVGAEILLPDGTHEAGGLPEVIVGCGAAVRREAFCAVGGYDATFGYYAEEYDLSARLLGAGYGIVHDPRFRVRHEKVQTGRDLNRILKHLVRNNGWVMKRYCPDKDVAAQLRETIVRYGRIAEKEHAQRGYREGLRALYSTIESQTRRPLARDVFDRFTGLAHARRGVRGPGVRVGLVDEGKNAWAVRQALTESGFEVVNDERDAEALVVGTLSPGPVLDALNRSAGKVTALWMPGANGYARETSTSAVMLRLQGK